MRVTQEARGRVPGDGVELAFGYWPGAGTPVVALHGITGNFMNFGGVAEQIASRCPLFALDLRGRGDSDKPQAPYGFAQHAKDVAAAMRDLGLGPTVVVGHSMGAFVATALAHQNPELVSALVLIDGGYLFSLGTVPADDSVNSALAERITQLVCKYPSRQAYREFWKSKPNFPPEDWSHWVERFLDYEVGGDGPVQPKALQAGIIADLKEGAKTDEILNRIRSIRVPVIWVRAETGLTRQQPALYPDSAVEEIRQYVPHIQHRKVSGTTHYTIVLGRNGASAMADLIVEMHSR
jgi:lipase